MGDPVLSWWWSGLVDDNDDRTWEWAHCNLINTILFFHFSISAGQKVPPSWSFWNEVAVPNITGHNQNCMQYLSGTAYGKENSNSAYKGKISGRILMSFPELMGVDLEF